MHSPTALVLIHVSLFFAWLQMKTRIREWRLSPVAAALVLLVAIAANSPQPAAAQELFQCPKGKKALRKRRTRRD